MLRNAPPTVSLVLAMNHSPVDMTVPTSAETGAASPDDHDQTIEGIVAISAKVALDNEDTGSRTIPKIAVSFKHIDLWGSGSSPIGT